MLSSLFAAAAAPAAAASSSHPAASDPWMSLQIPFLILLFVVFYFLLIRPQQKRAKEQRRMIADLAKGDEVIAAGILGKVTDVGEHFLTLEVADDMRIRVQKGAVTNVLPKGTLKSS